jgi:hypothetical protein
MDNLRKIQAAPPLGTAPRELVLGQSGGAYAAIPIALIGENAPFVAGMGVAADLTRRSTGVSDTSGTV